MTDTNSDKLVCNYCHKLILEYENYLDCIRCELKVHSNCIKRKSVPGSLLLGDVFFKFTCNKCSGNGAEQFQRIKVSWVNAIILALYNLSIQSKGLSHYGFFHFKTHIAYFIEKNWINLFGGVYIKKRKQWIGTVVGCLSQNSPEYFVSGFYDTNKTGWWKLSHNWTPRQYVVYRGQQRKRRETSENSETNDTKRLKTVTGPQAISSTITSETFIDSQESKSQKSSSTDCEDEVKIEPCKRSLFTKTVQREHPWKTNLTTVDSNKNSSPSDVKLMSPSEELEIYKKLKTIIENESSQQDIPPFIRRYYRKLHVRQQKRKMGNQRIFDIDSSSNAVPKMNGDLCVLDRFCDTVPSNHQQQHFFQLRLVGSISHELFESPFTGRILQPFIFRDTKCMPHWIKVMCELQYTVNDVIPERASVDYCYVRPQHIPAVNSLLQKLFWPGIDMSESLSYPDFTIVALYKKLVIGCAFLVPDVGHNEAYISFLAVRPEWQRAGLATFMLYHFTQVCSGKDITLHVSVNNPAICLYQKFGFKIEEVVLDFYDKYLPADSSQSHHAVFLRLSR